MSEQVEVMWGLVEGDRKRGSCLAMKTCVCYRFSPSLSSPPDKGLKGL